MNLKNLRTKLKIIKFGIYSADLSPRFGTEPGKTRPIVIIQSNLLNKIHPSTIVCPITSKVTKGSKVLRINLNKKENNLKLNSDILVDQVRAIDNKRIIKKLGALTKKQQVHLLHSLQIILFE